MLLFLDLEVHVLLQLPGDLVGLAVAGDVVVGRAGDDQRRAGFVDQDVVDFVDDREVQRTLGLLHVLGIAIVVAGGRPHVVAQVVEAELVVRAVGDVAGIATSAARPTPCRLGCCRPSGPGPCRAGPSIPCRGGPGSR